MIDGRRGRVGYCVLFDVDGTLCDTCEVDDDCYRNAVASALAIPAVAVDWPQSPEHTDTAIARWLWRKLQGRDPTHEEIDNLRRDFVERLRSECRVTPERFSAIEGAARFLEACRTAGVSIGIATGGWRASAELKLEACALPRERLQATSDDAETRCEIFALARDLLGTSQEVPVLVGDSVCDVVTARALGWGFLGVGRAEDEARLKAAGARRVIPNYLDATIDVVLSQAAVP